MYTSKAPTVQTVLDLHICTVTTKSQRALVILKYISTVKKHRYNYSRIFEWYTGKSVDYPVIVFVYILGEYKHM